MSEIEKMYENAKVKKYRLLDRGNKLKWVYPPFTAEKQLELIKWLGKNKQGLGIDYYGEWSVGVKFEWEFYKYSKENEKFTEALAGIINDLWQSLTEEEKQQVKGILE